MNKYYMGAMMVLVLVAVGYMLVSGGGRSGFEGNLRIVKADWVPVTRDDYIINWPGPPRRGITYNDVHHFKIIMELEEPAPITFSREYDIMADDWFGDTWIGTIWITFEAGSKVPSTTYRAVVEGSGSRAPSGTPEIITGTFWLGCTKKGKIKGNAGKNGNEEDLYIVGSSRMIEADGVSLYGAGLGRHKVDCF